MLKMLPIAIALLIAPAYLNRADATPLAAHGLTAPASTTAAEPVYYRRGAVVRGGVYRGPRGGVVVHGGAYRGAVVRGGGYRVGGRYYGGTWYGTGRRFYGGRWWAYGVGRCWAPSPIGFVWVCG
jgi:hypothetical protein